MEKFEQTEASFLLTGFKNVLKRQSKRKLTEIVGCGSFWKIF